MKGYDESTYGRSSEARRIRIQIVGWRRHQSLLCIETKGRIDVRTRIGVEVHQKYAQKECVRCDFDMYN